MNDKQVAFVAVGTFALGLVTGLGLSALPRQAAVADSSDTTAPAPMVLPPGHPRPGTGGLDAALMASLRTSGAMGTAPPRMPATSPGRAAGGATTLIEQAESLRRERKFDAAAAAYRKVIASGTMTADAWADYADALASSSSSLRGEPAQALERALALEPQHPKALWLKASLEHEERQYANAAKTWQTLLAVVPKDSSDARIIRANLAEATRLAAGRS